MARKQPVTLTPEHQALADAIGFDPEVLDALAQYKRHPLELRRLTVQRVGPDHHLHPELAPGFCFDTNRGRAEALMQTLREKFEKKGYLFFLTACGVPDPPATVAVIRGTDQYDILRLVGTEDVNGGQSTDDIIAHLRGWEARYPFRITGAGLDWVESRFRKNPPDMLAFAQEVIAFAPDSFSQVPEYDDDLETFAAAMRRARSFHLWWD
jgi:hypothetical protein